MKRCIVYNTPLEAREWSSQVKGICLINACEKFVFFFFLLPNTLVSVDFFSYKYFIAFHALNNNKKVSFI